MPQIDIYTKQQVDAKIPSADKLVPDTTDASQGDVLTVGASGTEWAAPSGGIKAHIYSTVGEFATACKTVQDNGGYAFINVFYPGYFISRTFITYYASSTYVQLYPSAVSLDSSNYICYDFNMHNSQFTYTSTATTVEISDMEVTFNTATGAVSKGSGQTSYNVPIDKFVLWY